MVSSLELLGFTDPEKLPPPPEWMLKEIIYKDFFDDNKMALKDKLKKKNLKELRAIVKKYNADVMIRGYSKMKKDDLIEAMISKDVMKKIKDAPEVKGPAELVIEEDEPVQGPRNLKKGFGIERQPKTAGGGAKEPKTAGGGAKEPSRATINKMLKKEYAEISKGGKFSSINTIQQRRKLGLERVLNVSAQEFEESKYNEKVKEFQKFLKDAKNPLFKRYNFHFSLSPGYGAVEAETILDPEGKIVHTKKWKDLRKEK